MLKLVRKSIDPGRHRDVLVLGITADDVRDMQAGEGKMLDGQMLGVPMDLLLLVGGTHEDMLGEWLASGLINEETAAMFRALVVDEAARPDRLRVFKVTPDE